MRLGGQLRVAPPVVVGWDMTAALGMARAMGIGERAAAELLPEIEGQMVLKLNERVKVGGGADGY
jgi:hypothetical protein